MKKAFTFYPPLKSVREKKNRSFKRFLTLLLMCLVTSVGLAQENNNPFAEFSCIVSSAKDRWDEKTDVETNITVKFTNSNETKNNNYHQLKSGNLTITSANNNIVGVEIVERVSSSSNKSIGTFEKENEELQGYNGTIISASKFTKKEVQLSTIGGNSINISSIKVYYETIQENKLTLYTDDITMNIGDIKTIDNLNISAIYNGEDVNDLTYKFAESNNPEVVEITDDNTIKAISPGTATISFKNEAKEPYPLGTGEINIIVNKKTPVLSAQITPSKEISLSNKEEKKLLVTAKDGNEDVKLAYSYKSENPLVAQIDDNGIITLNGAGNTNIVYTSIETDLYAEVSGEIELTVTADETTKAPVIFKVVGVDSDDKDTEELDTENTPYSGEKIRVYLSLPEETTTEGYKIKYSIDNQNLNNEYDGKYILLTSTSFIYAAVFKGNKRVSDIVQKTIRFDFTLLKSFENGETVKAGSTSNIEENGKIYVIATYGTAGDTAGNKSLWDKASKDTEMYNSEISGFIYSTRGNKDAMGESGDQFDGNAPAKSHTGETYKEESSENRTFAIPVEGAYVKFEPKMDGTINVIVRQNGIIANLDNPNTSVMRKRHIFVCDETGETHKDVKAIINANSTINTDIFKFTENTLKAGNDAENSIENLRLYQKLVYKATHTDAETEEITDEALNSYWEGDAKTELKNNILYKDGNGWITLCKAYVRYSFDVKAGKTYFLMGNMTKIGPCGYSFKRALKDDNWNSTMEKRNITYDVTKDLPNKLDDAEVEDANGNNKIITACNVTLTGRTFHKGVWTSLVLPFSISPSALEEAFGEGTEILHFNTVEGSKLNLMKHHHQMIVAGTPVLIKPAGEFSIENKIEELAFNNVTYEPNTPVKEMIGGNWKITGSYSPKDMPANSYYVGYKTDGTNNVYLSKTVKKMDGTRAWFESFGSEAGAKLIGFIINGIEDGNETTAIDMIVTEKENVKDKNSYVYNLNGQAVSNNGMEGLSSGIYIVNGKKVVVK